MNFWTFVTFHAVLCFSIGCVESRRSHCEHGDPHHTPCIFDNHGPPCPHNYRCNSRNNVCCPKSQKRRNHERYPNHLTCFEDEAKHIINKHGHRIVPECDLDRRDRTLYCRPDKRSRSRRDKKKRKEYFCDLKHNWCCPDGKYLENIYESGRDHGRDTGDQDLVDDQLSSEEDLDRDGGGSGHHRGGTHRRNGGQNRDRTRSRSGGRGRDRGSRDDSDIDDSNDLDDSRSGGSGHGGSGHLRSGTHHQKGGRNGHRSRSGGQGRDRDDDDSDRQIDDDSLDVEHNGASGRGRKKGKHGKGRGKDRDRSQDQDQDGPLHDDQNDLESGEDGSRENSRNHKGGRGKGSHHNARGGQHQSQHNGNKRNGNKGDRQAKGRQGKGNVHKHPKGQNQAKKGPHTKKKPQG